MSNSPIEVKSTSKIEVITSLISPAIGGLSFLANDYFTEGLKNSSIQFYYIKQDATVKAYCLNDTHSTIAQMYHFRSDDSEADRFFLVLMNQIYTDQSRKNYTIFRCIRDFNPSASFLSEVASSGFHAQERFFMTLNLDTFHSPDSVADTSYACTTDITKSIPEIIDCIHDSVAGSQDALLYPEYTNKNLIKSLFVLNENDFATYANETSFLFFDGPKLIGLNLVAFDGDNDAYISQLAVHPDYRRKKLGKLLMIKSILALQSLQKKELFLHVTTSNPALVLYETLGFVKKDSRWVFIKDYNSSE